MGKIVRIGYRHLEAIRFQTIATAMGLNWAKRTFDFREWISDQAPELVSVLDDVDFGDDIPLSFSRDRIWNYAILLNSLLVVYESQADDPRIKFRFAQSMVSTSSSDHAEEDYSGTDKGGAWNCDPFPFRAGIILTLGALEEFERGILRIVTGVKHAKFACKSAKNPFRPGVSDFDATNPIWDDLDRKKETYSWPRRRKELVKLGLPKPVGQFFEDLRAMSEHRNKIAHGFKPINSTLSDFLATHYNALAAMNWYGKACRETLNIEL